MSRDETRLALLEQDTENLHQLMSEMSIKQNALEERQRKIDNRMAMFIGGTLVLQFVVGILVVWLHKGN